MRSERSEEGFVARYLASVTELDLFESVGSRLDVVKVQQSPESMQFLIEMSAVD